MLQEHKTAINEVVDALITIFTPEVNLEQIRSAAVQEQLARGMCRNAIRKYFPESETLANVLGGFLVYPPDQPQAPTRQDYINAGLAECPFYQVQGLMQAEWMSMVPASKAPALQVLWESIDGWRSSVQAAARLLQKQSLPPLLHAPLPSDEHLIWRRTDVQSYVETIVTGALVKAVMSRIRYPIKPVIPVPPWVKLQDEIKAHITVSPDINGWLTYSDTDAMNAPDLDTQLLQLTQQWGNEFEAYVTHLREYKKAEVAYDVCVAVRSLLLELQTLTGVPVRQLRPMLRKVGETLVYVNEAFQQAEETKAKVPQPPSPDLCLRFCRLSSLRAQRKPNPTLDSITHDVYQDIYEFSRLTGHRLMDNSDRDAMTAYSTFSTLLNTAFSFVNDLSIVANKTHTDAGQVERLIGNSLYTSRSGVLNHLQPSKRQMDQWASMGVLIPGFQPRMVPGQMSVNTWLQEITANFQEHAAPLLFHLCYRSSVASAN